MNFEEHFEEIRQQIGHMTGDYEERRTLSLLIDILEDKIKLDNKFRKCFDNDRIYDTI